MAQKLYENIQRDYVFAPEEPPGAASAARTGPLRAIVKRLMHRQAELSGTAGLHEAAPTTIPALKDKLDTVQEGATDDQTAAEVLALLLTVDTDSSGLNATSLQGFLASAFLKLAGGTLTGALVLAGDPTQALHPATKQYVDAVSAGLSPKPAARVSAITNQALSGLPLLDTDVQTVAGDRVLLLGQTDGTQNGPWLAASGAWTRPPDFDAAADVAGGAFLFVREGFDRKDTGWALATDGAINVGTTVQVWAQFSGPGAVTAGTGLSRTGNQISADFGTGAGKVTQGNDGRLSDTRTPTDGSVSLAKAAANVVLPLIVTSLTRPASAKHGQLIFETDTNSWLKNTATADPPAWSNVDTTGGGGGSAHVLRDEGTDKTQRGAMNFVGDLVSLVDDSANGETEIRIGREVHFGTTAPDTALGYRIWLDTNTDPAIEKWWDGDSWEIARMWRYKEVTWALGDFTTGVPALGVSKLEYPLPDGPIVVQTVRSRVKVQPGATTPLSFDVHQISDSGTLTSLYTTKPSLASTEGRQKTHPAPSTATFTAADTGLALELLNAGSTAAQNLVVVVGYRH